MRFIFIVQGEGRGHMTQAIAMYQWLSARGQEVSDVVIGSSERREVPAYVYEQIGARIHTITSPNFITDSKQKSVKIGSTLIHNLLKANVYRKSLRQLDHLINVRSPDVVINFYDFLGGIWHGIRRPNLQYIVVGHQYLISHPEFPFAPGRKLDKALLKIAASVTAWGAKHHLALSFRELGPVKDKPWLRVWPPLLRKQLLGVSTMQQDFILGYVVNPGYGEDLCDFATKHPGIRLEVFWDQKGKPNPWQPLPNLRFHQLNGSLFLDMMGQCKGMVSTAGFESICEAMYLRKPVMMVPVQGQYEQVCNAFDGELAGAGIAGEKFDLQALLDYMQNPNGLGHQKFQDWYAKRVLIMDGWLEELTLNSKEHGVEAISK